MERLIAIIGPTAVGKTLAGITLAKKMQTEIISGDSMLVFRRMNIGTAKPDMTEREGVIHHLIDILEPNKEFSVAEFQKLATKHITDINARGKIPILAGGTGLYVKALVEDYQFNQAVSNTEFRQELILLAEKYGNQYVHNKLAKVQPEIAARLHPNNLRRVIRALEVHHCNGESISQEKTTALKYDTLVIGLNMERNILYERINLRVDTMIKNGLIGEVASLLKEGIKPESQAMQGIGYKEIVMYLNGRCDLDSAIENIKQATRNFAKRQLTWYRKMPYIHWIDVNSFSSPKEMMSYIYSLVAGKYYKE